MSEELPFSLLTNCKLTFSDKVFTHSDNLQKLLTNNLEFINTLIKLQFMITGSKPLVIEKCNPSQEDICTLFDAIKELLKVAETPEVHQIEDKDDINNSGDNHKQPVELRATDEKIKSKDLIQIQSTEATEGEKQFTKHVQDNDGDGRSLMMSSQQEKLIDNELIDLYQNIDLNDVTEDNHSLMISSQQVTIIDYELIDLYQNIDVNVTEDKECSKESNNEKRSDPYDNEINRGEAIHIIPGASSDLSLKQTNDQFSFQIDSKSSLLQVIRDSLESHVTEREKNNNANDGKEHETQMIIVNRQNSGADDSSFCKEVLTQPELVNIGNTVLAEELEGDLNSVSDTSRLPCVIAYEANKEITEIARHNAEFDHTVHTIGKESSEEEKCEDASNSGTCAYNMEPDRRSAGTQVLKCNLRSNPDGQKNKTQNENVPHNSSNQYSGKQEISDSSLSDEESQEVIYSLKASSFHVAKTHFMGTNIQSCFDIAVKDGTGFTFKLNERNQRDAAFLKKVKFLKFEELEFVHEDIAYLKAAVRRVRSEVDQSTLEVINNKVHIIGPRDFVTSAKKKLNSLLHNRDPKSILPSEEVHRKEVDKLVAKESIEPHNNDVPGKKSAERITNSITSHDLSMCPNIQQSSMPVPEKDSNSSTLFERPYDFKATLGIDFKDKTEMQTAFDKDCNPSTLHERPNDFQGIEVGESGACKYTENDNRTVINKSDLKVLVYKANITELKVDCIVNSTNSRLQHYGGVANVIAAAAGPAMTTECKEFINSGNSVPVTYIFVSTGGKLYKHVIHAVGPMWDSYSDDDKTECFEELRQTVLRCLVEAGRREMTSIALPSISAANLKVPKEECARCYMEAVKHFDVFNAEEKLTLREIHFVDIDDTLVNYIRESFLKGWPTPSNVETVQKDCTFAKQHLNSASGNEAVDYQRESGHDNKSSDDNTIISSVSLERAPTESSVTRSTTKSEINATYQIGKFTLIVNTRPAFDQISDLTITIGKPFDKLSGIQDFILTSNSSRNKGLLLLRNVSQFVNVYKPGDKQSRLVCVVYPEPENKKKMVDAFKNIEVAIQRSGQNVTSLVITSSILYAVPSNTQQKKGNKSSIDQKNVEIFAQCVFSFLNKRSVQGTEENTHITVVGSEDVIPTIKGVLESCIEKTEAGAMQGAESEVECRQERSRFDEDSCDQRDTCTDSNFMQNSGNFVGGAKTCNMKGLDNKTCRTSYSLATHRAESWAYCKRRRSLSDQSGYSERNKLKSDDEDNQDSYHYCFDNQDSYHYEGTFYISMQDSSFFQSGYVHRMKIGNQPHGTMTVDLISDHADGYETCSAWRIEYYFPSGTQDRGHPNPGSRYKSATHTAYLPANKIGFNFLMLLRLAFIRKLTFTIDDDSIIWNDIHHKTSLHGGVFGFPDRKYFARVKSDLANNGIVLGSCVTQSEKEQLDTSLYCIQC